MSGRTEQVDYLIGDDQHLSADEPPARSASRRARRSLVRDPMFWIGAVLVTVVVASAVFAPLIAPHDPDHQFRSDIPVGELSAPPSPMFPSAPISSGATT